MQGQIIKILSNDYFVLSNDDVYICKSRGKFRKDNITPLVGDYVIFDSKYNYILDILPRKNSLFRPAVANIDQAFIITSLTDPLFSTNLLDKFLVVLEYNKILPIICLTKKDLINKREYKAIKEIIKYYKKIGYIVVFNTELKKIKRLFKNKTTVFTGQTGSGKSTLMNRLDKRLNFDTDETSKALGRGKHTTRHIELVALAGGKVLDTPGFSSIDISNIKNIKDMFIEFKNYACPFKDCNHINEKKCEIINQVKQGNILNSRYENYKKFINKN